MLTDWIMPYITCYITYIYTYIYIYRYKQNVYMKSWFQATLSA